MTWNISYSYRPNSCINSSTREEQTADTYAWQRPFAGVFTLDTNELQDRLIRRMMHHSAPDFISLPPNNQPTKPYSQSHLTTAYDNTLISTLVNGQYQVNTGTDKLHSS